MTFLLDAFLLVAAIVSLGVLVILHEGGHYLVARWCGMRVDRFSIGFGKSIAEFRRGETVFQIGRVPLGGFVQIAGLNPHEEDLDPDDPRSYPNRPAWQRIATIFAGPFTNYLVAAVLMVGVFVGFGYPVPRGLPSVQMLVEDKPAFKAGMQLDDEVVSMNGQAVQTSADVQRIVNEGKGAPVDVVVKRFGKPVTLHIQPYTADGKWLIGVHIGAAMEWTHIGLKDEVLEGLRFPVNQTIGGYHQLVSLLKRQNDTSGLMGPVGIVKHLKRQIHHGPADWLFWVGVISVALGFFNLLPVPALDGGRIVFLAWELLSRRRVNQRVEAAVHMVGMLVLLSFILWVTVANDFGVAKLFKR